MCSVQTLPLKKVQMYTLESWYFPGLIGSWGGDQLVALNTGCSLNIVFFPLNFVIFLNSASSAAALVFYFKIFGKNTIFNEHPVSTRVHTHTYRVLQNTITGTIIVEKFRKCFVHPSVNTSVITLSFSTEIVMLSRQTLWNCEFSTKKLICTFLLW